LPTQRAHLPKLNVSNLDHAATRCQRGARRSYHGARGRGAWIAVRPSSRSCMMDELNGRMIACQILITGLIARVANNSPDPLRFLTDFRDEIRAVVKGVNIAGMDNTDRVRQVAQRTVDELFSLMKPPSVD
jgi:putative N-acetylmannosamine-6-phosphate epimerase